MLVNQKTNNNLTPSQYNTIVDNHMSFNYNNVVNWLLIKVLYLYYG